MGQAYNNKIETAGLDQSNFYHFFRGFAYALLFDDPDPDADPDSVYQNCGHFNYFVKINTL